jgi:hypothetical protein
VAVTVRSSLWRELRGQETVLLRFRPGRPADAEAVLAAVAPAVGELRVEDPVRGGTAYVSAPVAVPDGAVVLVDFDGLPPARRRQAVERLVARLEATPGVPATELGPAPAMSGRFGRLFEFSPVARALLRGVTGEPAGVRHRPPVELVELAVGWVRAQDAAGGEPLALVMSAQLETTWAQAPSLVLAAFPAASLVTVASTDFRTAQASATFGAFRGAGAALTASRRDGTAAGVARDMRGQRDLIREHVDVLSWAGVTVETDGQVMVSPAAEGYDGPEPGPMWFQVLTAEQVRRLGGPPEASVPLADGRAELTVGEPEQWVPGHPEHEAVRSRARALLTPG